MDISVVVPSRNVDCINESYTSQSSWFEHTAVIQVQSNFIKFSMTSFAQDILYCKALSISLHFLLTPVNYVINSANLQYYEMEFSVYQIV